jgi:predicted transcriptional regulator
VTFLRPESFMAAMSPKRLELMRHLRRGGPLSVRRLSQELGRDYKSVHGEVAMLEAAGLIGRTSDGEATVVWDRIVTELDLAA